MARSITTLIVLLNVLAGCHSIDSGKSQLMPAFVKKTFTYKVVGDAQIKADVYRPDDTKMRPVVVWLHGGALVMGSRQGVPKDIHQLCRSEGFVLVSLDYRLAPEVKLQAIIQDVKDAFCWIRQKGPKLFYADAKKMVVAGGSAGGYLTMMTGICVEPRPTALVAYYGYGDIDGHWYTQPSEYYLKNDPLWVKEEVYKAVGSKVLTGTSSRTGPTSKARSQYYHYLRQHGLWTREVTGLDPESGPHRFDRYCPVRNITAEYPPLLMIHGTNDNDVPYEKSAAMAKELARHNVLYELITVPDAGHGLRGGDKHLVAEAYAKALEFIKQHLE